MDKTQFKQLIKILEEIKTSHINISKKLNVLISPQFKRDKRWQDKKITRANIQKLQECGIDYGEIASILNMSPGTVANELTLLKKRQKR